MTRETYKGRRLSAKAGRGRDYGRTFFWVNGQLVGISSKPEVDVILQLRRDVDAVDADERVGAYSDYWYVS